ncbi:FAD-dependent oxidoreductase [Heyndrickxia oleronia]|uniref:(2Fe-2S)-binding protein n=1 Tax=Heyndrickxia oleronia TaxID=38875 RepID=A0A8E2I428_9BACI|nr:FAD-dependent oxidoreductase [Heyndrickxia oleronia]MEC1376401.1 FAD-dependent oxidoreductase [Heyndrickxia oleronia]OOP66347.1 (2Fe-2S)-binding protein [Heyndrickxia oleronia]QQZ06956.1 FAD-dependent oxidoreductase [Heyndrickxia oleronia]
MPNEEVKMPQFPEPIWKQGMDIPGYSELLEDIEVDVAIVGGGITGITTGYLLTKEGLKVAIIEAGELLNGTTGHTTAKVTAQHGLIYDELIQNLGKEQARLYYEASTEAIQFIKETIKEHGIECDFSEEDAYIFTNSDEYIPKLKTEEQAYKELGINGELVEQLPIDYSVKAALVMRSQAQFHPIKYLKPLIEYIQQSGGLIFEHTTATDVDYAEYPIVITRGGPKVKCKYVCACSHFPFYDGLGFYPTRMYAERSYLIAVKTEKDPPPGMYINAEQPTRSFRRMNYQGENVLLVGGENHKTGQGIPTIQHYEAIEEYAQTTFGIKDFLFRWSAQDLTTLDKVPYIGRITSNHDRILVATGFRKWGMTNSTVSALLIRDIIREKENRFEKLFSPSRFNADPSVKEFISTNFDVAKHLVEGKLEYPLRDIEDLEKDEGSVVNVNGKRAGAYRDSEGKIYVVDTTCTHLGCEVEWNSGDRTWDCPCHGSRFSIAGDVIEGPAETSLEKIDLE